MRVMVVGPLGPDDFADNVRDTLTRMGHEVHAVGAARPSVPIRQVDTFVSLVSDHTSGADQYRQRHLVRAVQRIRPDVPLCVNLR